MSTAPSSSSIDQRYWIVLGACLTQFVIIGLLFSFGLYFKPLQAEFGWSRTFISSCASIAFLVMGTFAFFGGHLTDRYGPRLVLATTGLISGSGFVLMSQISQQWQLFILMGFFVGLGLSTHDVVTLSTVAKWFKNRRGLMTGVVKTGTAIGQMTIPPMAAFLILSYGWQTSLIVCGVTAATLLIIAALLMKDPPEHAAERAQGGAPGLSFGNARKTPQLWMLCAIQFSYLPTLMTVPLHIAVHGMDLGMSATVAASLLTVTGGASIAGRLLVGTMVDRIGGRRALILCFVPLISSLLALLFFTQHWALFAVVALYGFAHGGLFTVMSPTVAEYFGLRAHGAIFGLVLFCGTIGGAIGPVVAGRVFDVTGSYDWAFIGLAVLVSFGLILVLKLPAASTFTRN